MCVNIYIYISHLDMCIWYMYIRYRVCVHIHNFPRETYLYVLLLPPISYSILNLCGFRDCSVVITD